MSQGALELIQVLNGRIATHEALADQDVRKAHEAERAGRYCEAEGLLALARSHRIRVLEVGACIRLLEMGLGPQRDHLASRAAMDVVVIPTGSEGTSWSLKDRLGRPLGMIERFKHTGMYEITPDPRGGLMTIPRTHLTLDQAMTVIAKHMHEECTLDSQDWD